MEFLFNEKTYTKEQIKAINKFKSCFRVFFEGCTYDYIEQIYETHIPIRNFEITNLIFDFPKNDMIITIRLENPGILIGKGGRTIDSLKEYITDVFNGQFKNVKLNIVESKLWRTTFIPELEY